MTQGAASPAEYAGEVLTKLATGLSVDSGEISRRVFKVVRARSPESRCSGDQDTDDPAATLAGFFDFSLASLRTDIDLSWPPY